MKLKSPVLGPAVLAVSSQAISSLANFVFVLSLLKNLTPAEFGLYSIAFAFVLAMTAVFQGFFQVQMVTELSHLQEKDRRPFAASLYFAQVFAGIILFFGICAVSGVAGRSAEENNLAIATAAAILGLSSKEFLIRYLFAIGEVTILIPVINFIVAGVMAGIILNGSLISGSASAMMGYAGAHIFAAIVAQPISRITWRNISIFGATQAVAANGGWAALSALVYSLRSSAHTLAVGASLSLVEVGRMNAARTLVTPVALVIPTLSSLLLPRLSQVNIDDGIPGVLRMTQRVGICMAVLVIFYAGFLALFWPFLNSQFFSDTYESVGIYVALWLFYALSIALRNALEWAAQAIREFRALMVVNLFASFVTVGLVLLFTAMTGVPGAIIGVAMGELIMFLLVAYLIHRKSRNIEI